MNGFNVMLPIGFDAFGLPAENAAIKDGIHPMKRTYENIERMRKQLRSMGAMWDWRREAISCDPEYYKWTQWFFIQLYKHGLAYRKMSPVDFCPHDNTTLAREQVWGDDRHCERCGTPVIKKNLAQWFFKTTAYADELLNYEGMDWPERVKLLQTNWIGRSEGRWVTFKPADLCTEESGLQAFIEITFSPPAPTPCGVSPSWCFPPSTRWWRKSPHRSTRPRSKRIRSRLPASQISTAKPLTRKRLVSSPAAMPSTRSMAKGSPSGSLTMS